MIWWPEEIPTLTAVSDSGTITLRPVLPTDAEDIYRGAQDPEVPMFTSLPANYTLDNAISFATNRAPSRHASRSELIFAITVNRKDLNNSNSSNANNSSGSNKSSSSTNSSNIIVGVISLHSLDFANHRAEVGYWMFKEARNKGICTAAVEMITDYGLMTMGFRRIDGLVNNSNEASKRLLLKSGYEY
ncbi:MAG: GNAT family N-acetyltransferase [Candidatus Nanopelagicaceae bacterium]